MPTSSAVDRSVPKQRIVRLVWALCGLAIAVTVSALVLQVLGSRPVAAPVLVQDGLLIALEVLCAIVGALISVHRPGNRIGGLLLAGASALSVFSFLENYFGYAARQPGLLPDLRAVAWIANGALLAGVGALVLMLLLYRPGCCRADDGDRWPGRWPAGGWLPSCCPACSPRW
jgi:hypothetical protein